jgi:hypothetical protein
MALTAGTRLEVYEIVAPIGEGGMVWSTASQTRSSRAKLPSRCSPAAWRREDRDDGEPDPLQTLAFSPRELIRCSLRFKSKAGGPDYPPPFHHHGSGSSSGSSESCGGATGADPATVLVSLNPGFVVRAPVVAVTT